MGHARMSLAFAWLHRRHRLLYHNGCFSAVPERMGGERRRLQPITGIGKDIMLMAAHWYEMKTLI